MAASSPLVGPLELRDWVRWREAHGGQPGAALFGSRTLAEILSLLTLHPGRAFPLSEVCWRLGLNQESSQRAMSRLMVAGVVDDIRLHGRRMFTFPPGPDCLALKVLCLRTVSLGPRLHWARSELGSRAVEDAFVFGSVAAGTEREDSDVDVLTVGSAETDVVGEFVMDLTDRLDRAINVVARDRTFVASRLETGDPFYRRVWEGARIPLLDTAAAFAQAGRQAMGD